MADVKWIKLTTDMFDNRKIKHLRKLPEGNNIVLIWVMLLTMAGRCNASGMIFLTENIPYTTKMLADELDFEENTVKLALQALESFNMIHTDGDMLLVTGWQEYQNVDRLAEIREYNRLAKQKSRAKQKLLAGDVNDTSMTSQRGQDTDIDIDKELDIEKERIDYNGIKDAYNNLCPSLPAIKTLSDARKRSIKARLNTYTVEDLYEAFRLAEESDFLKGKNDRNWTANFDWIMKDANLAKILDGNYASRTARKPNIDESKTDLDEFF